MLSVFLEPPRVQWPLAPSKRHRMDPPRIPAKTLRGSTGRSDSPMLGESERTMDPSRVLVGILGGFKRRPLEGASGHLTFVDSERGPLEGSSGYPWRVQRNQGVYGSTEAGVYGVRGSTVSRDRRVKGLRAYGSGVLRVYGGKGSTRARGLRGQGVYGASGASWVSWGT